MRFVVFVRATKQTEAGVLPTAEQFLEMGRFNEALAKDGVMLSGDGLHPTSAGARLRFDEGKVTVTDGPFAETKELVAGFWMVQGKSKEEIVERFRRAPFHDGSELEIRRVYEAEDFGESVTPEVREQRKRIEEYLPQT